MISVEPLPLLREQLVRLAQHRLGDQHAAEDVAQEALTRLLESRQTFTSAAHLTGWAVTTTKNLCADHHRQQRRSSWGPTHEGPGGEAADSFTLSRDLVDGILAALATMPDRQAAVLLTAARLGSTDRTALAAATGETESAVRNYLHRGRAALRSKLSAAGHGAFGLQPVWSYLRHGPHRRVATAGLLLPVLSLMTVFLRLPFSHDAATRSQPVDGLGVGAPNHQPPDSRPAPGDLVTLAASGTVLLRATAIEQSPGWVDRPLSTQSRLPVQLLKHGDNFCVVDADGRPEAGPGDCGFDLSDNSYTGVSVAGQGLGISQGNLRCSQLPSLPGVICIDPSPSPRAAAALARR